MLMSIRDRATGLFAWVIVVLLIIPFALWGIQEYLGGGSAVNVAIVGDLEISRNTLNTQVDSQLRGKKDQPEGKALVAFRKQVLDQMIREEILYQSALDRGFRINEAVIVQQIQTNPAFHVDGRFDSTRYEELLRYNGLTPSSYQSRLARDLITRQFVGSILQTSFVTPDQIDRLLELQGRKLDLAYMEIPFKQYQDAVKVTDEQVNNYYEDRKSNFMTPERVRVDYLILTQQDIEAEIKVTEEQLRQYYDDNKDSFITPEQRRIAHIMLELDEDAKADVVATTAKQMDEIHARLEKGESFGKLAKLFSADAGSASQGGEIGILEPGTQDKAFEEAAVKLNKGEYSKPVRSAFGFHIIKVVDVKPGSSKPYEEVKPDAEAMYKKQQAETLFFDRKEALYNQTYENPDSLDIASQELGIKIKSSPWFTRSGLPGDELAGHAKIVAAAFEGDVFASGDVSKSLNSKLIEIPGKDKTNLNSVVVVRLSDYQVSQLQALETVKAEISRTITSREAAKAMQADVDAYLKQVQEGASLESLAKEKSLQYKAIGFVGRVDNKQDSLMLSAAFKSPKPGKDKTSFTSAMLRTGNAVIIAIKGMEKGKVSKDDESRPYMSQFMQRMLSTDELNAFVEELKSQTDIKIFESRLTNDET